ncbi:hypothetical protein [Streptomyces sp. NBC_00162]|uniref:hypothetical protein n=1 Tax=Streptomyces sp. NBC_00162 TaxID=2903629 RepID=UPI00214C4EB6|nr:hypothetical protein [Streptomyces sp. NBC_00162]UUU38575.1 hypothetical protein JIW86_06940 [Streptomyces sp. NBC_00162]
MITADPRHTSRVGLFVGILSALLFAVLHCSSPLPGDGLPPSGTASVGAAAAETASQHPAHPAHPAHHIDCLSPGLAPQAQNEPRHSADAEPALPSPPSPIRRRRTRPRPPAPAPHGWPGPAAPR